VTTAAFATGRPRLTATAPAGRNRTQTRWVTALVGHQGPRGRHRQALSVAAEEAFKNLKGDLAVRPIHHQKEERIEAHIFIAFLAYCLHATLRCRLRALAPGLTPRSVFDKFASVQMIDVHIPTTDGRELVLERYTEPERDLKLLLGELKLILPEQPPPKITASAPLSESAL